MNDETYKICANSVQEPVRHSQDACYNLLKDIEIVLRPRVENNNLYDEIVSKVAFLLKNYDVSNKCYALTIYNDENIRILNRYKACLLVEGKSEQTIEAYDYRIRHMFETSQINLKDIGPYDIRFYLAILKKNGVSNVTLDGIRCYINAFYKWMVLEGYIEKNPCAAIKPIKYTKEVKESSSELDLEKIRSSCKDDRERAIVELLLSSGVRVGELVSLNVDDIDFKENSVHVRHGKGDKERITYMSPVASYYMNKYLQSRKDKGVELIHTQNGRLQDGGVRWILKDIGDRAGVENVHPHRFRRTFATTLNNKGMPLQSIQHLMGHSRVDTTLIYVAVNEKVVKNEYMKYMQV